ncbi:DUF2185 domain-containing protein [Erysipelothrix anatis]|uniref:DUF2185 domain-containing protein n=1 Tax=Erysipelothrix anatis TaxID=2683713 RepID=UPI00140991DE|nr:DUF2185 domain-containing protein [Erysipelothrix anatis]
MFKRNTRKKLNYTRDGFIKLDVRHLIDWEEPTGDGCIVSDMITKEGWKVGYMFRDEPNPDYPDSGWRFLKGDESNEYMSHASNHHVFKLNTVCNYDQDIIPYLTAPVGTHLIRTENDLFIVDDEQSGIVMSLQDR